MGDFSRSRNPFWSFIRSYRFTICTYLHIAYETNKVERQRQHNFPQHSFNSCLHCLLFYSTPDPGSIAVTVSKGFQASKFHYRVADSR